MGQVLDLLKNSACIWNIILNMKIELKAFEKSHSGKVRLLFGLDSSGEGLKFSYNLIGSSELLNALVWPLPKSADQTRHDDLWKSTAFELFVAQKDSPEYMEFNFSPSGDWNAYRFKAEREGMTLCPRIQRSPIFEIQRLPESFTMQGMIDRSLLGLEGPLELGVSAVLDWGRSIEYWAAAHHSDRPDFHNRSSFIVKI